MRGNCIITAPKNNRWKRPKRCWFTNYDALQIRMCVEGWGVFSTVEKMHHKSWQKVTINLSNQNILLLFLHEMLNCYSMNVFRAEVCNLWLTVITFATMYALIYKLLELDYVENYFLGSNYCNMTIIIIVHI